MTKMFAPNASAGTTGAPANKGNKSSPNPAPAAPSATGGSDSAAPSAPDKKAKTRVKYAVPETGLEAWPTDHDPKKHKPLMRGDFKDEAVFLEHRAAQFDAQAKKLREEAEQVRKFGPGGKGKVQKLQKVQGELDALIAHLKAQGMDVDAVLATAKAATAAATAPTAAPAA
jgi:hypothetical protein